MSRIRQDLNFERSRQGRARYTEPRRVEPDYELDTHECPSCDGSGMVFDQDEVGDTCNECDGFGFFDDNGFPTEG